MPDFVTPIIEYFQNLDYVSFFAVWKEIATIISIILGIIFVFIIYKIRLLARNNLKRLGGEINPPAEAIGPGDRRWQEIKKHLNSTRSGEWKFAIVEADKLVDDALKTAGFKGESMGERMTIIQPEHLASLSRLWEAHKIRNLVVHDNNFQIRHDKAVEVIESFEGVLRELGAID